MGIKTSARIQPFCRKFNIKNGCFNGEEITPRNLLTEKHHCLYITIISVSNGNQMILVLLKQ